MSVKTVNSTAGTKFETSTRLAVINCGKCGGVYAITERHRGWCEDNRKSWNCPYCRTGWGFEYLKEQDRNEVEKAKRLQEAAERSARKAWAEAKHQANRARAEKAAKTRIKNRVSKGVCPCCNRTFQNLQQHMVTQHPDYSSE